MNDWQDKPDRPGVWGYYADGSHVGAREVRYVEEIFSQAYRWLYLCPIPDPPPKRTDKTKWHKPDPDKDMEAGVWMWRDHSGKKGIVWRPELYCDRPNPTLEYAYDGPLPPEPKEQGEP